jgi:hypothetical protein
VDVDFLEDKAAMLYDMTKVAPIDAPSSSQLFLILMTLFQMYAYATSVKWNTVNGELEEAVIVYFKVFPTHFFEQTEENKNKI